MKNYIYYFVVTGIFSFFVVIMNFEYANGETPFTVINDTINTINELEPFYIAESVECIDSKQIQSNPYIVFQDKCIEKGTIKGIGQIINHETFVNTIIENKTVFGQGKGIIYTEDNQSSIGWQSYDANLLKGGYSGHKGIIFFNSTTDNKFEFLNNTVGVYESDSDPLRAIWLWK
ncbi:MAG: hypothetical protein ACPKPY_09425 [Nitrososphaeraceae archaeon]